jgi:hypothetical protein
MAPREPGAGQHHDPDFERIVRENAQRLGVPVEQLLKEAEKGPPSLAAAKEKSRRFGTSAKNILRDDIRRVEASDYPTEACATPEDFEEFARSGDLPEGLEAHLSSCENCKALLALARPRAEHLEQFMDEVRAALSQDLPNVGGTVGRL